MLVNKNLKMIIAQTPKFIARTQITSSSVVVTRDVFAIRSDFAKFQFCFLLSYRKCRKFYGFNATVTSHPYRKMDAPLAEHSTVKVEEIKIHMPWGVICGKWWGPKQVRPIVCLHGWMDNAGTFDTLIPLLPQHLSYLAFDLPGHGLSSWLPDGVFYHSTDFLHMLLMIMKHYDWKKISLLGHSMGSICVFNFSSVFNDIVDLAIGLDALKPHVRPTHKIVRSMRNRIPSYMVADERNRDKNEPPIYTYDEMIEKLHIGTFHSVDPEHCKYLLNRNIKKSERDPMKYYFSRDNRLKSYNYGFFSQELNLSLAEEIKCPYLFIKSLTSTYYEEKRYYDECIEVMQKNPVFEVHEVEGTHHVHLNDPTKVSGIISDFIYKYRPAQMLSKL